MADIELNIKENISEVTGKLKDLEVRSRNVGKGVEDGSKDYEKSSKRIQKSNNGILTSLKGIAPAIGVAFATTAVINFVKDSVKAFAVFEKSLSSLSSITGAVGKDLQFYEEQAKLIGSTSTKSAVEAVEAFKLIGSAKPELLANKEALASVTREAVILAEASGLALPDAAKALTGALNQFGLEAEQANRVINALASGSKAGASAIPELSDGIKVFGAVASSSNVTVEQSIGLLETLAEKQIEGSIAGTNLRNVILKLSNAGKGFVNGQFDITKALEETKEEFDAIQDPVEKTQRLTKLFGLESITAGKILLSNIDTFKRYTNAVTDTNTATEQAEINTNNLEGSFKIFQDRLENLTISTGDFFSSFVKGFTDLGSAILKAITPTKDLTDALEEERIELFNLETQIFNSNTTQEERIRLIDDLKKKYPVLLKNVDSEATSYDELKFAIKQVNDVLKEKIKLSVFDEEISEKQIDLKNNLKSELNAEKIIIDNINKAKSKGLVIEDAVNKSIKEQGVIARDFLVQLKKDEGFSLLSTTGKEAQQLTDFLNILDRNQELQKEIQDEINSLVERRNKLLEQSNILNEDGKTQAELEKEALEIELEVKRAIAEFEASERAKKQKASKELTEQEIKQAEERAKAREEEIKKAENDFDVLIQKLKSDSEQATIFSLGQDDESEENLQRQIDLKEQASLREIQILEDTLKEKLRIQGKEAVLTEEQIKQLEILRNKVAIERFNNEVALEKKLEDLRVSKLNKRNQEQLKAIADQRAFDLSKVDLLTESGDKELTLEEFKEKKKLEIKRFYAQKRLNTLKAQGEEENKTQINLVQAEINGYTKQIEEVKTPKKLDIAKLLGVSKDDFQVIQQSVNDILGSINGLFDRQVEIADEQIDIQRQRVEESENRLDALRDQLNTELQLREQGFASDVEATQEKISKEQVIKDQEFAKQKELEKKKASLDKIAILSKLAVDTASAISSLVASSTANPLNSTTFGAAGVAQFAAGIIRITAGFASAKSALDAIPKFKKGGGMQLQGASHEQGGMGLYNNNGRKVAEFEGKEWLQIINKGETKKHLPLLQAINSGKDEEILKQALLTTGLSNGFFDKLNSSVNTVKEGVEVKNFNFASESIVKEISSLKKAILTKKETVTGNGYRIEQEGKTKKTYVNV